MARGHELARRDAAAQPRIDRLRRAASGGFPNSARAEASAGLPDFGHHAAAVVTTSTTSASGLNTTLSGAMRLSAAGTSAMPCPQPTEATCVATLRTSWRMRGTVKASAPSVGGPIRMTGVDVAPGDLVVADDDGVVVLPAAEVARVLLAGEARAAKEADFMRRLAEGATTVDLLGLAAWRERA